MASCRQEIREIVPESIAEELQIEPGDELVSIDGQQVEDIFDYQFLIQNPYIEVLIRKKESEEEWLLEIEKEPEEDLGIIFDSGLMDAYHACHNRCIFCFIDKNPPGMRNTLYFKDDDARLSFLQGNYITLTNMRQKDIDRIIRYRMEPINISFHTTDPELRVQMLRNRHAGESLQYVKQLAEAGIEMNGQIVLCRGVNDGEHLDRTIEDLTAFLPYLKSLSVVPVGITRYREGLYPLSAFTAEEAGRIIKQIENWQDRIYAVYGTHFVHAADEFYLQSGFPLPDEDNYDGYPQLENGVGRMRLLSDDIDAELAERAGDTRTDRVSLASGMLVGKFLEGQLEKIRKLYPGVRVFYYPIRNMFYGESITVTGLVTGGDLIQQLKGQELGDRLLLPGHMLRQGENVFLDDVTVEEVETALSVPVEVIEPEGASLCRAILGEEKEITHKRRQMYEQTDRSDRRQA